MMRIVRSCRLSTSYILENQQILKRKRIHQKHITYSLGGFSLKTYILKFRMCFKYGLKAQKLLAQGIALGIMTISKAPCFTLIEQALSVFFNVNYI